MQLADCPTTAYPAVTDSASQLISEPNQSAYLRLKLSLSLNLRRQVFLAVCDNLALRNRLAAQLYVDLAYPAGGNATPPFSRAEGGRIQGSTSALNGLSPRETYPRLVSLTLNLREPNPINQVTQWLAQHPHEGFDSPFGEQRSHRPYGPPAFQVLGIEHLTRQPAYVQQRFLIYLQQADPSFSALESTLLLWLTRPWFHTLQQSAPAFWNCHTALFEFEGDPTPARAKGKAGDRPASPAPPRRRTIDQIPEQPQDAASAVTPPPSNSAPASSTPVSSTPPSSQPAPSTAELRTANNPNSAENPVAASDGETIWDILTEDLAHLNGLSNTVSDASLPEQTGSDIEAVPETASAQAETSPAQAISAAQAEEGTAPPQEAVLDSAGLTSADPLPVSLKPDGPAVPPRDNHAAAADFIQLPDPLPIDPLPSLLLQIQPSLDLAELVRHAVGPSTEGAVPGRRSQALQLLQHIEELQHQENRSALADAYQALGNLFRDRIEQGEISELILVVAILAYEQTLTCLEEGSSAWPDILNDIGNLYWMMSRQSAGSELALPFLEHGLAAYQFALVKTNPEERPQTIAMIQNNLGSAYGDLARYRDPAETLQQSVQAYEEALHYRTAEDDPSRYAATQNNLGTAYWNLAQHQQPVLRLKQAIAAYSEALRYYSQERDPLHYAMIQNNLGTTYWNLAQHKQPASSPSSNGASKEPGAAALLLQAVEAYQAALRYRTLEVSPPAHAATQNNLGTAYWHLAMLSDTSLSNRVEYLQQAIAAYKAALSAVQRLKLADTGQPPALTFDIFATHNNLGLAYYHLAMDKYTRPDDAKRSSYLESALQYHMLALQGWEQQPDFYQTAFSYLLQTVRAFYSEFGMKGQQLALSKIPATLLPELMKRL